MTAYIITRDRTENLKKIVPRWLEQDIPVVLVVEWCEYEKHISLVRQMRWGDVIVMNPVGENKGVGYARKFAVAHAARRGFRSIIMSDDDMRPSAGSDMHILLQEAAMPGILGVGAVRSLHSRFSGGLTDKHDGLMLCPAGWGMQLFALNVRETVSVGNFDPRLDCWGEDHELMRNGIAAGIPWLVHCGVKCEAIGKRYEPGGLNSYVYEVSMNSRAAREIACRKIIHARWPRYVSSPEKAPRMAWQQMLDDYIPGWRLRSAMHGGIWC